MEQVNFCEFKRLVYNTKGIERYNAIVTNNTDKYIKKWEYVGKPEVNPNAQNGQDIQCYINDYVAQLE